MLTRGKQNAKFETKYKQSEMKRVFRSTQDIGHLCKWLETSHSPLYLLSFITPTQSTSRD